MTTDNRNGKAEALPYRGAGVFCPVGRRFSAASVRVSLALLSLACLQAATLIASQSADQAAGRAQAGNTASVTRLRCEYKVDPLGIDVLEPRLGWQVTSTERGWMQSAYQVRVARSAAALDHGKALVWDSGKVTSAESTHRAYAGPPLQSGTRYFWQVRVWDSQDRASGWSTSAWWEMGLLKPQDWQATWIQPALTEDPTRSNPAAMLRKQFQLRAAVQTARAYITSLGLYDAEINGRQVSDDVLTPGWTSYDDHLQYQTYDVTSLLKPGDNAIGATLGDGWYRGLLGFGGQRATYGTKLALLLQVVVTYKNGSRDIITSDATWKAATGPILASDIYNGEMYDARLERRGWTLPGYDDSAWTPVGTAAPPKGALVASAGPPIRRIEEIRPVSVARTPAGDTVVDMGQNMVGWVRLKATGAAGTRITLQHAEVLDKDGNFYIGNLRAARQIDEYVMKGGGEEVFEPHFTFHGFRYVRVKGLSADAARNGLTGIVVHSDITPAGSFECSNPLINQLQHNIQWGQKGNFVDVPTDCPQRDERLGWMGDAQVFARTAAFNADVAAFYTKWLKDVTADQKASGAVPDVIPNVLSRTDPARNSASAGWADAAVIVPWTVYLSYGDTRILEQQYPSMKRWVDYIASRAGSRLLWNQDFTYGDWLAFATNSSDYPGATTDKDLVQQAYFARSTDLLQRAATVLGRSDDARTYANLLAGIKKAFVAEFVTGNGRLASNTQTAYALALAFDLLPEPMRPAAAKRLADDVRRFGHITTGFLGAPLVCHVLSDYGYVDEAFLLVNRSRYPSWLYPVTKGATTIWERWDGIKPDGSFQDAGMNSFNHYAYGAIGEWLYRFVAGVEIDAARPGYRHILIQPHAGGKWTFAKASHQSLYGRVSSGWVLEGQRMAVTIEVPPNTTATVRLPGATLSDVLEGGQALGTARGVTGSRQDAATVVVEVGSGRYEFSYPIKP